MSPTPAAPDDAPTPPDPLDEWEAELRARRRLRRSSRAAVWGMTAGLTAFGASTLGVLPVWLAVPLIGLAVVVSGVGTVATSVLVLRRAAPGRRLFKVAALLGVPMGALLAAGGVSALVDYPLLGLSGVLALLVLAPLVLLLFAVAFVVHGFRRGDGG